MPLKAFDLIDRNDLAQVELATWLDYGEGKEMVMSEESFQNDLDLFLIDRWCKRAGITTEMIAERIAGVFSGTVDSSNVEQLIFDAKVALLELWRKDKGVHHG
jgi:hypothetical protein